MAAQRSPTWSAGTLDVGGRTHRIARLGAVAEAGLGDMTRLPRSIRVLLENLLRHEDESSVTRSDIAALASWVPSAKARAEIAFRPARVVLQDFTGVPAVVDLAAMRDAMAELGGDPARINPLCPVELVVDHSVQIDHFGSPDALALNAEIEFTRNRERYEFLRWGQSALEGLSVVPPSTGIVHQVNIEYLAQVVFAQQQQGEWLAFPDTLVGADSHTTMVNGLGVLGWGVGGIEAEACLLGQPVSMLIPDVVGFELGGRLPEGATATDLVLTVVQLLRAHGVVGKFVEFFGSGLNALSVADRATVANMAPEYGATVGYFPIDQKTLEYLELTGREDEQIALVEAYARAQGVFALPDDPVPEYSSRLSLDLGTLVPSLAGPKRPQDRVPLTEAHSDWSHCLPELISPARAASDADLARTVSVRDGDSSYELAHGHVVIAAITSCTNTSNPSVLVAAGLLAKNAVELGLEVKPWVKTSLAPGSRVVRDYLAEAGLLAYLEKLRFNVVGYGCTTCIGNSGPLPEPIAAAVDDAELAVAAVLSGNRNFEGRVNARVRANYLASPPLVVAYALAGRMDFNWSEDAIGRDPSGRPVMLRDIWPTSDDVARTVAGAVKRGMFRERYANVFEGDEIWKAIEIPTGVRYPWSHDSTYVRLPSFFQGITRKPAALVDVHGARALVVLGDSVTTDHISPAGSIPVDGPAGRYLLEHGIEQKDFNSFGARRGNHEVLARGTFANVRLRNQLVPGVEGGYTVRLPDAEVVPIFDAAEQYRAEGVPLIALGGLEYGTGSSRDWAAKGPLLLGIRAVIVKSYERIHRSNLIGMGILPLEFLEGQGVAELGLSGRESFDITGLDAIQPGQELGIRARSDSGDLHEFTARVRIDTPVELDYYQHGGILPYVLRELL